MLVITQRQSPNASQEEAITFRCQACNAVLLKHDYRAPTVPLTGRPADNHIPIFPTLAGSQQAAEILNEHEANRTCPKCGRINERFPDHLWGWKRYLDQGRTVNEARKELLLAADGGLSG